MTTQPFHAVRCSVRGEYRTYEIYRDNERYLIPPEGGKVGRREAVTIVTALNRYHELLAVPFSPADRISTDA
jgi:hypothetical protein